MGDFFNNFEYLYTFLVLQGYKINTMKYTIFPREIPKYIIIEVDISCGVFIKVKKKNGKF